MVKAVDLATAFVMLVTGVVAFLLVVAVAEHWIVSGGFTVIARTALFAVLIIGVAYFVCHRIWPLLVRAINPVYAARAIEQGSPSLKNSLINLLFFRERRAGISDAVYRTLEEQAAQRLTRVPVETSVDRTPLIRLGYVLITIVAVAGLYKVFSPKDPIISAERILLPWADIVPASRVTISGIAPGSVTVSRGEFVDVSAEVHGLSDDDAVVVRYTTDDGDVVGKSIPMKPTSDGLRYACRLSEEVDGSDPVGLTRSLTYWLAAGDARSLDYAIKVVSAPSILVERVDYHYPPYTGYVDRTVEGLGDIRAVEGTRITIHSRANGAIRAADVDFDADGRPNLRMTTKESGASASFELGLREDRQTPRHASYVLRFTNEEGRTNRDPVKHAIAVERDYDPEVSVLLPKEKAIDVRLDETVAIEVEARDPDFALSTVRLHGEAAGQSVLDETLLKAEHRGRFTKRYSFVPSAKGLKAGDTIEYWVEAADNRTPKPNTVSTKSENRESRTIRIVSPNPAQQPPPDRVARNDRQQPKPGADQQDGQQEQRDQQPGKNQGEKGQGGAAAKNDPAGQQQGGGAGGQQQPGKNQGEQQGENQQSGNNDGEQNADNQQQSKGDSKSGGEGKATNAQGGEKGDEQKSGENGQGGAQSKSKDGLNENKGEQTGAGAAGSQSSKDAAQPAGTRQPDQPGAGSARPDQKQEGEKRRGGDGEKAQRQSKPDPAVSSEGDNDGEAFERIQKHMEKSGELKKDEEQTEGEKGREGEGEKSQKGIAKNKPEGESKSADGESGSVDGKSGAKQNDATQKQQPGQQGKDQNQGAGANANGDDVQQKKEVQPGEKNEQQKSPQGQETGSKGPAGAGEEKQPQGSPNSQPDKKPTEKHEQSGSKEGANKQEPPAGANGKKESDSSGEQGGDKAGGGEEGAGQKAPREGTGSAGDHQSADNGTGESAEKGKGETSSSGGEDAKSDHKTGSSDGKTAGKGDQQKDGTGEKAGGKDGGGDAPARTAEDSAKGGQKTDGKNAQQNAEQKQADKGDKQAGKQQEKQNGKQGDQPGKDAGKNKEGEEQGKSGGASGGGGQPGGAFNPQPTITGSAPEGDAANLEYARKQTDLVLDKLSDQLKKNKVDDRMLKELGWSREDLRRFIERWQQRKDAAQRDDPKGEAAKRELDEALRSLGLQREKLQQNAVQKDTMRDLKQGYRGPVPLEYQERLRAYNQGVSRAARESE